MKEMKRWNHLVDAVKQAESTTQDQEIEAPLGFSTRVSSVVASQRKAHLLLLWKRWSLLAAASSIALVILALVSARSEQEFDLLVPVPDFQYPSLKL